MKSQISISMENDLIDTVTRLGGKDGRSKLIEEAVRVKYHDAKRVIAQKMATIQEEARAIGLFITWEFDNKNGGR
jgi:hypothetical protein